MNVSSDMFHKGQIVLAKNTKCLLAHEKAAQI